MMGEKGAGTREENQDRLVQRKIEVGAGEVLLLAIADGVSRCPHGAEIAHYLINQHLALDPIFTNERRLPMQVIRYLRRLNRAFYKEYAGDLDMLDSACTLSVILLENEVAHCIWVGDSPIYLARDSGSRFDVTQLTVPDVEGRMLVDCFGAQSPFKLKYLKVELRVGDVIVVASDGVSPGPESFGAQLNRHGPTPRLLQAIVAHSVSSEFYDDATLVHR